ncbi:MAG: hypothetical protein CVV41_03775 [Candidatus Riflebacteria bacterium HGW-Riflebacteria-1]|jgi:hypothetical protein|nr:MAG: hypothetical protein CVV41_03775 [Candidatus Riflebacteria bacterium HGW-Riflebacteria-1]
MTVPPLKTSDSSTKLLPKTTSANARQPSIAGDSRAAKFLKNILPAGNAISVRVVYYSLCFPVSRNLKIERAGS